MAIIKIIKKPWGEERLFAHTKKYAGKILIVRKGHRLSLQFHRKKDEVLYLEEGILKLTFGKTPRRLQSRIVTAGENFHFVPNTIHRIEALDNCRLIEVSTNELSDVVRISDDYGRVKETKKTGRTVKRK